MAHAKAEIQRLLHQAFHPAINRVISTIHFTLAPLIRVKRSNPWKAAITGRFERASQRTTDRICAEFPDLRLELTKFFDLFLVLSDLEREHFPKWWTIWVEELKREELLIEW